MGIINLLQKGLMKHAEYMQDNRSLEYLSALLSAKTVKGDKALLHFLDVSDACMNARSRQEC